MSEVGRYLRILFHFARIGVIRKSQFRVEFWTQVVMDILWYSTHILVFEILFLHAPNIAGWTRGDIRVFLGFLFISDAFMMMWLGQAWHFPMDLKDGKLDPVRVRPANPVFLYFFRSFSLEATFNMTIAATYLLYALVSLGVKWSVTNLAILAAGVFLAFYVQVVLTVLFAIPEFFFLNSDVSRFLRESLGAVQDRPLDIFSRRVKVFFLTAVPIGAIAQVPAALILGRIGISTALLFAGWLLIFSLVVFRLFVLGFRRYESAMG